MATPQQIEANRKNSQNSTGATSETGKQRSSLNATRHCFTGQPLVLSDVEKEAYEFNVLAYVPPQLKMEKEGVTVKLTESASKIQTKDEVLAELMAEHIALKKSFGEL